MKCEEPRHDALQLEHSTAKEQATRRIARRLMRGDRAKCRGLTDRRCPLRYTTVRRTHSEHIARAERLRRCPRDEILSVSALVHEWHEVTVATRSKALPHILQHDDESLACDAGEIHERIALERVFSVGGSAYDHGPAAVACRPRDVALEQRTVARRHRHVDIQNNISYYLHTRARD